MERSFAIRARRIAMMTNQKRRSVVTMALKLTPTQTDTDTTQYGNGMDRMID